MRWSYIRLAFIGGGGRSFNLLPNFTATKLSECADLQDRRECLATLTLGTSFIAAGAASAKDSKAGTKDVPITVTLPLEPSSGGTFCVRLTVFASDEGDNNSPEDSFRVYKSIVDTGSPYLVLPSSGSGNDEQIFPWMTKRAFAAPEDSPLLLSSSEYTPTDEIYGAVKGQINWKSARYMFRDPRLQILSKIKTAAGVVGVLDDALTNEATGGGMIEPYALLGLIRNSNPDADRNRFPDPRPSFIEQEILTDQDNYSDDTSNEEYRINSFSIDGPNRKLTLSTQSLIRTTIPAMRLVDLRKYGDFVDHYAVVVDSVSFNEVSITSGSLQKVSGSKVERPIVAVFDTGLTGCLLIRPFWDVLMKYMGDKSDDAGGGYRSVSLYAKGDEKQKQNNGSSICKINSSMEEDKRFYVQPIDLDWFDDEKISPFVIVLGQTFLRQGLLTIDINQRLATFR